MAWLELPKRLQYALESLCCLVSAQGPVHADEVARRTSIPPAEAAKILNLLAGGGFLSSRRGSKGGFWLRMPPDQVRVGSVLKFLYPLVANGEGQDDRVLQVWKQTAAASREAFEHLSLKDLAEKRGEAAGVQVQSDR